MTSTSPPKRGARLFSFANVLAVLIAVAVLVGMLLAVARSASGVPLTPHQKLELTTVTTSDINRIVLSQGGLEGLAHFSTAKSSDFIPADEPKNAIPGSFNPKVCVGMFYRPEQPNVQYGGNAFSTDVAGNQTQAATFASQFQSGSDAAESYSELRSIAGNCLTFTFRQVNTSWVYTMGESRLSKGNDYTTDADLLKVGVPNFETTRVETYLFDGAPQSVSQVQGTYLLANTIFYVQYVYETKLGPPEWGVQMLARAEQGMITLAKHKLSPKAS
jgi:hypothetical protein